MGRAYRWLTPEDRQLIEERLADGWTPAEVAGEVGCSTRTVDRVRAIVPARAQARRQDSGFRLSIEERLEIARRVTAGQSNAKIAEALGRHRSTIGREIARCEKRREEYSAFEAERQARRLACRPKPTKLSQCPRLVAVVEEGLEQKWSPEQISAKLRIDHPDDPEMRISHETIYLSLFLQSRGELRKQLTSGLRTQRKARKPQGQLSTRGRIIGMASIAERPAEVEDRAVPGHWEGDLILGGHKRSAVATLVERQTRFVILAYLGYEHTTAWVIEALKREIQDLPAHLKRSLTWDQGKEMAAHRRFTVDSGVQVYFCDPHSPWQRGSNENTNGLLRQYLPKGTDLAIHDQDGLDRIAAELNGRPRKTLGWDSPAERLEMLLGKEARTDG